MFLNISTNIRKIEHEVALRSSDNYTNLTLNLTPLKRKGLPKVKIILVDTNTKQSVLT